MNGYFLLTDALLAEQSLLAMTSTEDSCAGRLHAIGAHADQGICIAVGLREYRVIFSTPSNKAAC